MNPQYGLRTFLSVILVVFYGFVCYGMYSLGSASGRLPLILLAIALFVIAVAAAILFLGLRRGGSWTFTIVLAILLTETYAVLTWFMASQIANQPLLLAVVRGAGLLDIWIPIAGIVFSSLATALLLSNPGLKGKRQQ